MESSLSDLKKVYNKLLAREKNADEFFKNPSIENRKKDFWVPEYIEITRKLSLLIMEYEELTGTEMTEDEMNFGFK